MAKLGDDVDGPIELRFIATLGRARGDRRVRLASRRAVLGFGSAQNLVAGKDTGATTQLYVYDAGDDTLDCASCPADGSLPAGPSTSTRSAASTASWQGDLAVRRWVSSEGTVFFTTATALLPADQNIVNDVYEYRDGELSLITPGTGTTTRCSPTPAATAPPSSSTPWTRSPPRTKSRASRSSTRRASTAASPTPRPSRPATSTPAPARGAERRPRQPGAGTAAFEGPGNPEPSRANPCAKPARKAKVLSRRAKRLAIAPGG